jgi:hypothetical protein
MKASNVFMNISSIMSRILRDYSRETTQKEARFHHHLFITITTV